MVEEKTVLFLSLTTADMTFLVSSNRNGPHIFSHNTDTRIFVYIY